MTLEEAIERLADETVQLHHNISPEWVAALNLGIEALKRIKRKRAYSPHLELKPLLGETEEAT